MSHALQPAIGLAIALLLVACGGDDATSPSRTQTTPGEQLGREIGETYLTLLDDAEAMLALDLPAEQLRPALARLRDDYRVRFANLGCLRETLDASERQAVERAAAEYVAMSGPLEADWLRQATARYGSDPAIATLLAEVQSLQVYAFFEQLEASRPGETPVCGG